jgi:hypothetical protein
MTRSIFGWSYPPGCSGPPEGNDELEAFWDEAWERPEIETLTDEAKRSLIEWIVKQVSDGMARGRQDVLDAQAEAAEAEAESKLAEQWRNSEH